MKRGKFIVFEGLDGSGKSSHIKSLKDKLCDIGEKVYMTAEPTDYETGKYIRRILTDSLEKNMYLQAALFLADRLEHITNPKFGIEKYLNDGYTVICDRYYYSSFAYQGTASDIDWVMKINLGCEKIIKPDICIFLDVEPSICKSRIDEERDVVELYEKSVKLMNDVRNNFFKVFDNLKEAENIKIINANRESEIVEKEVFDAVSKLFKEE